MSWDWWLPGEQASGPEDTHSYGHGCGRGENGHGDPNF